MSLPVNDVQSTSASSAEETIPKQNQNDHPNCKPNTDKKVINGSTAEAVINGAEATPSTASITDHPVLHWKCWNLAGDLITVELNLQELLAEADSDESHVSHYVKTDISEISEEGKKNLCHRFGLTVEQLGSTGLVWDEGERSFILQSSSSESSGGLNNTKDDVNENGTSNSSRDLSEIAHQNYNLHLKSSDANFEGFALLDDDLMDVDDSLMDAETFQSLCFQPLGAGGLTGAELDGSDSGGEGEQTIEEDEPPTKRGKLDTEGFGDGEDNDGRALQIVAGESTKSEEIGSSADSGSAKSANAMKVSSNVTENAHINANADATEKVSDPTNSSAENPPPPPPLVYFIHVNHIRLQLDDHFDVPYWELVAVLEDDDQGSSRSRSHHSDTANRSESSSSSSSARQKHSLLDAQICDWEDLIRLQYGVIRGKFPEESGWIPFLNPAVRAAAGSGSTSSSMTSSGATSLSHCYNYRSIIQSVQWGNKFRGSQGMSIGDLQWVPPVFLDTFFFQGEHLRRMTIERRVDLGISVEYKWGVPADTLGEAPDRGSLYPKLIRTTVEQEEFYGELLQACKPINCGRLWSEKMRALCQSFHSRLKREDVLKLFPVMLQRWCSLPVLQWLAHENRADREVVLCAVSHGSPLKFASEELRADRQIALAAAPYGNNLEFMSANLRGDREVVLRAFCGSSRPADSLKFVSTELRGNREVVMASLRVPDGRHGCQLQFASEELRGVKDVVLRAVVHGRDSLKFASADLRNDRDVVRKALVNWGSAQIADAGPQLRDDKDFALQTVQYDAYALQYFSSDVKQDKHVVFTAVCRQPLALRYVQDIWGNNIEIVTAAVSRDPISLVYASTELRDNHCVAFSAAVSKRNWNYDMLSRLMYASERVRDLFCDTRGLLRKELMRLKKIEE